MCIIIVEDIGEIFFDFYIVVVLVEKGEMVVFDDEFNRVYIFIESGNYFWLFRVKFGDLYDVVFLYDKFLDGIFVVNCLYNWFLVYCCLIGKYYFMFYVIN